MNKSILLAVFLLSLISLAFGCTSLLVTPGAAKAGNSIIYYSADNQKLVGSIKSLPAADYPPGTMQQVYDWDSGFYTGEIPQVEHTYNVIANINEHGLTIGETTFGGLEILCKPNGIVDYGTLIWTALQRSQTAREAIQIMANLTNEYGYHSEGESFSIADKNEVWVLEMIGKGEYEKGTVWVAQKVQDGHISAHANQARITTFDRNSSDVYYAEDVVSFARSIGLYKGSDEDFSFSDTYAPVGPFNARISEARVWALFNFYKDMSPWLDYAQGRNISNRLPWSIPISEDQKLSLNDTFWVTRNHNEGTWFQNTNDVGAGAFNSPYRWNPLSFPYNGKTYYNERFAAVQQTSWNFASEIRQNVPKEISAVTWFAMDDSACGVKVPIYGSNTKAPQTWSQPIDDTRNGNIMNFDFDQIWWVTNMVSNLAYSRWSEIYPQIAQKIVKLEEGGFKLSEVLDKIAIDLIKNNQTENAFKLINQMTNEHADLITENWQEFFAELFVKYRDGGIFTVKSVEESPACGCGFGKEGYSHDGTSWYGRIANETGTHYMLQQPDELQNNGLLKRRRGFRM